MNPARPAAAPPARFAARSAPRSPAPAERSPFAARERLRIPGSGLAPEDADPLTPRTDLAVTKTDSRDTAVPGEPLTYTVTVANAGPSHAVGVAVADTPPPELLSPTWTCSAQGGATCGAAAGTAAIAQTADLPPGGSVVYALTATLDPGATGDLLNLDFRQLLGTRGRDAGLGRRRGRCQEHPRRSKSLPLLTGRGQTRPSR